MIEEKDKKILELLMQDAKLTTKQMSKKTLMPITTIHNRIKKMEKEGIIKGYYVKVDQKKLGNEIAAFILVGVTYVMPDGSKISQMDVAKKIKSFREVEEAHVVTGGTDIIVKVRTQNIEKLNDLVINKLRNISGVGGTQTLIVLTTPEI